MGLPALSVLIEEMRPLPGLGSSLWSQAPTDNTFRLVSCVFLLILRCCVSAQRQCREEEYSVGDECCPMCNPAMNLVTWQECSSRNDTVCRCSPGFFCKTQEGDHCSVCWPHSTCPPGQRVQRRGTYSQDTVCADCLTGTFSQGGTQEECQPWTKCKTWIEKAESGTSSTDVTCSVSAGFIVPVAIFVVLLIAVPLAIVIWRRSRLHTSPVVGEQEPFQGQNTVRFPVTEVGPAMTEEETALNCEDSG